MPADLSTRTSEANGRLWGARARDWAEFQEKTVQQVYEAVFERTHIGKETHYLDVGCGSGLAAAMAAELGATVSGIDASDKLLEIARQRLPDADIRLGDLEDLPFASHQFDLVTGFNSFQYAGNPSTALAEARRVAKPSGTVVIMTWGEPDGMEAASLVAALKPLLPSPPPGAPGPFALSSKSALEGLAESAGLEPLDIFDVDSPWEYHDEASAIRGLGSSGVAARAMAHSGEDKVDAAHAIALAPFRQSDGRFKINATFRCLLARPMP